MPRDTKQYKAIYFDLRIKDLEQYYSAKSPKGAYQRVKTFMLNHGFDHAQYSGYHSRKKMTDLEVVDLIEVMRDTLPWLGKSANHFEVTNIGANSDLMYVFADELEDPL
jgi:virulence-associated protein VapD